MAHPWMLVIGSAILGWLLPEILAVFGKVNIPIAFNLLSMIAFGLIVGSFVL